MSAYPSRSNLRWGASGCDCIGDLRNARLELSDVLVSFKRDWVRPESGALDEGI